MAIKRRTTRELADERNSKRREEMHAAIAEGRLTVRQMTATEREGAEAHRAAGQIERAARTARRGA